MNSFKKFMAAVGALVLSTLAMQSQKYIYVYKGGNIVAKHEVASVDSVSIEVKENEQQLSIYKGAESVVGYNVEAVDSLSFEPKISVNHIKLKMKDTDEPVSLGFACSPLGDISSADVLWASSDNSVATVKDGVVSPVKEGKCVIKGTYGARSVVCNVTVIHNSNIVNGYEYVDLGLKSGTLWATCNVGATKREEYGDYYAWGETETKETYTEDNSKWYRKSMDTLQAAGVIDAKKDLTAEYDVVKQNWGDDWGMPTVGEIKELCALPFTSTELNGVAGKLFKGPNGATLFLPFAGYRREDVLRKAGEYGNYWTASTRSSSLEAECVGLELETNYYSGVERRYCGCSVRPVLRAKVPVDTTPSTPIDTVPVAPIDTIHPALNGHDYVDLGLESGTLWATFNIGASSPEEYGDYFAWGETETKDAYESNCMWCGVSYDSLIAYGVIDENGNLTAEYDVATKSRGEDWRMPTLDEINELLTLPNETVILNGVKGKRFTGTNGATMFLPFAGNYYEDNLVNVDKYGSYWSASLNKDSVYGSHCIDLDSEVKVYSSDRSYGFSVRPVRKK